MVMVQGRVKLPVPVPVMVLDVPLRVVELE
jgi:hypothetical protein